MQPKAEQETVAPYQVRGALVCLHKIYWIQTISVYDGRHSREISWKLTVLQIQSHKEKGFSHCRTRLEGLF
jgi:hypothetical protein